MHYVPIALPLFLAFWVLALIIHLMAKPVPGVGIAVPALTGLVAVLIASLLGGQRYRVAEVRAED